MSKQVPSSKSGYHLRSGVDREKPQKGPGDPGLGARTNAVVPLEFTQHAPEAMAAVSDKALHAALHANRLIVRRRPVPWSIPKKYKAAIPKPFPWGGRTKADASADLLGHLRDRVVGVPALKGLGLCTLDASDVTLHYRFKDNSRPRETEAYTLTGNTDAIITDRHAAGIPPWPVDAGAAMGSALMLVNFRKPKASEGAPAEVAPSSAAAGAGESRTKTAMDVEGSSSAADDDVEDADEAPLTCCADYVLPEGIMHMLAFHAAYGRWVPVVATDFATYVRIWEHAGMGIWELALPESGDEDAPIRDLTLDEGIATMRLLLAKGAEAMPAYDAALREPEEEDFEGGGSRIGGAYDPAQAAARLRHTLKRFPHIDFIAAAKAGRL